MTTPIFKICPDCGSDDIWCSAHAIWHGTDGWILDEVHEDEIWCKDCEQFIEPKDATEAEAQAAAEAHANAEDDNQ